MQPSEVIGSDLASTESSDPSSKADQDAWREQAIRKVADRFGAVAVANAIEGGRAKGFEADAVLRALEAQADFAATPKRLAFRHLPVREAPAPHNPAAARAARKRQRQNRKAGRARTRR